MCALEQPRSHPERPMVMVRNPQACTGCLICEMACSFHHIRGFSRNYSSVKVIKSIFEPDKVARITISYDKSNGNPICDLCVNENFLFCIRFCPENVFKMERIHG